MIIYRQRDSSCIMFFVCCGEKNPPMAFTFCASRCPMMYDKVECSSNATNFSTSRSRFESEASKFKQLNQAVTILLVIFSSSLFREAVHIAWSSSAFIALRLFCGVQNFEIQSWKCLFWLMLRLLNFSAVPIIASIGNVFNWNHNNTSFIMFFCVKLIFEGANFKNFAN